MNTHLERVLRAYVAQGAGIDSRYVLGRRVPAGKRYPAPKNLHASLLLVTQARHGYPVVRQAGAVTVHLYYWKAEYSLQFYREGAVDAAQRFYQWAMSQSGLLAAETAYPDGGLAQVRVYDGGRGYDDTTTVRFAPREGDTGTGARGRAVVRDGSVARIDITAPGEGYIDSPTVVIEGAGTGAAAATCGHGFKVRFPMEICRLDALVSDHDEERAVVDFGIEYASTLTQDTGRIDDNRFELCIN